MPTELILVIAAASIALLLPVLAPMWTLLRPHRHTPEVVAAARVGLFGTALITLVGVGWFAGISTSIGPVNVCLFFAAVLAGLVLSVRAFFCRPAWLGVVAGLLGGTAWMLMLLLVGFASLTYDPGHVLTLSDGKYCRASRYGGLLTDSGTQTVLFRRFVFLDYSTGKHAFSEIDAEPYDAQYANKAQFQECLQKSSEPPRS